MSEPFSLYLHFPYCWSKCSYCAFNAVLYDKSESLAFIQALKNEITLSSRLPEVNRRNLATVFMGGGTPTIFSASQLLDVLRHLRSVFDLEENSEITVEANPGTVSFEKLKELRCGGVNRLSLGVQSFKVAELESLGRVHSASVARKAFHDARDAGFRNINIDFISGLPGQCWKDFQVTLREAVSLEPEHISVYSLTPEEGTPFGTLHSSGKMFLPGEDDELEIDERTRDFLDSAGYFWYEVSNFARSGYECRHNLGYWEDRDFIGLGPGAHSFMNNRRFSNIPDIGVYIKTVRGGKFPVEGSGSMKGDERFFDALAFGLRKTRGVHFEDLINRYQPRYSDPLFQRIKDWTRAGLVIREGFSLRLSAKGIRVWDRLGEEILACYESGQLKREPAGV